MDCYFNQNGEMVCYRKQQSCGKCISELKYDHNYNKHYIYSQGNPCVDSCPYQNGCGYIDLSNNNKSYYGTRVPIQNMYQTENTYLSGYKHRYGKLRIPKGKCCGR